MLGWTLSPRSPTRVSAPMHQQWVTIQLVCLGKSKIIKLCRSFLHCAFFLNACIQVQCNRDQHQPQYDRLLVGATAANCTAFTTSQTILYNFAWHPRSHGRTGGSHCLRRANGDNRPADSRL